MPNIILSNYKLPCCGNDFKFLSVENTKGNRISISDLAKGIKSEVNENKENYILINAEFIRNENDLETDYLGIEVYKYLRIKHHLTNPILLFGFSDITYILQKHPEHIIITAPGVQYLQLPFDNDFLNTQARKLKPISKESLKKDFKPFIQADFDIEQIAHAWANFYGLLLMQNSHNLIFKNNAEFFEIGEKSPFNSLDIHKTILLYNKTVNEELKEKCRSERTDLVKRMEDKSILVIDDQGEDGWYKCYKSIFYDDENTDNFHKHTPKFDGNNEKEFEDILQKIANTNPNLIFLDLRLKGDKEQNLPIDQITGYQVLQKIHFTYPSIPVIITSATNKAENLSALLKAGAFDLWTKPRVDTNRLDVFEQYGNLLNCVNEALNETEDPIKNLLGIANFKIGQLKTFDEEFKVFIGKLKPKNVNNSALKSVLINKYIIVDTNLFLESNFTETNDLNTHKIVKYQLAIYLLFKICQFKNKTLVIIDDVLEEIYRKAISDTIKDKDLKKVANQSLKQFIGLKQTSRIIIENERDFIRKHLRNINYMKDESKDFISKWKIYKYEKRLISIESSEEKADKLIERRRKKNKGLLHADDTFKGLIYEKFKQPDSGVNKAMIINNDKGCKYEIAALLENELDLETNIFEGERKKRSLISGYSNKKDENNKSKYNCSYTSCEYVSDALFEEVLKPFLENIE